MQGEQPIGSPVETVLAALRGAGDLIGVELRLLRAELASKSALLGSAFIIVATGARPFVPEVPGPALPPAICSSAAHR